MAFLGQEGFHLIIPDPNHLKVGRFHVGIGNDHDSNAVAGFDGRDIRALLVQKERRDGHGDNGANARTPFLQRFLFQNPQHGESEGAHIADNALPGAPGADDGRGFFEGRPEPLPGHFHEAEAGDPSHLHPGTIRFKRITHAVFHRPLIPGSVHVDEVDDNEAAHVPQA